jgi:hypothetical protein
MYTRAYTQCDGLRTVPSLTSGRSAPRAYDLSPPTPTTQGSGSGQASSVASVNGPAIITKWLLLAKITQWHKDGKCFHLQAVIRDRDGGGIGARAVDGNKGPDDFHPRLHVHPSSLGQDDATARDGERCLAQGSARLRL